MYVVDAIRVETLPTVLLDSPGLYRVAPNSGRLSTFSLPH